MNCLRTVLFYVEKILVKQLQICYNKNIKIAEVRYEL